MKKFKFRFEIILKQRKTREEQMLKQLALAQRAHQEALAERGRLENVLKRGLEERQDLGKTPVTGNAFRVLEDHIKGTKQRIVMSQQAISRTVRGVEKALRAYLFARRETGVMETLRDKEYAVFKKERAKQERKQTEDIVVMRARFTETKDTDGELS